MHSKTLVPGIQSKQWKSHLPEFKRVGVRFATRLAPSGVLSDRQGLAPLPP